METEQHLGALVPLTDPAPRIHHMSADAIGADGWVDEALRILIGGVDSCTFSFATEVSEETYLRLLSEQLQARLAQQARNATYCSEWLGVRVLPSGAKGYAILLESDKWTIKVQKGNPTRPPLYIEMRSFALHTHPEGVLGACEAACRFIRDVLLADAAPEVRLQVRLDHEKLSRFDLHVDWQGGWHPTLDEGERRQFIKPGHARVTSHLAGERCTGYHIGKRRIVARVYNKSIQAKAQHLDWYFALLQAQAGAAFSPEQDVWRLEFELRREGVQGFCLYTPPEASDPDEAIEAELEAEDLPTLGTIRKALHWAGQVVRYLMTRWLRLVVPRDDTNRARWPTHPDWQTLQAGFMQLLSASGSTPLPPPQAQLVRTQRHTGQRRLLQRMGLGIAAAAELLLDSDPAVVLPAYLDQVRRVAALAAAKQAEQRQWRGRSQAPQQARRMRYLQAMQHLAEMALGVFAAAGVVQAELPRVGSVADLLCVLVDDLEELATAKGGIGQVLYDKWCKVYKLTPPRDLFTGRHACAA
jgi:hypothetical protein